LLCRKSRACTQDAGGVYLVATASARGKVERFVSAVLNSGAALLLTDPAQASGIQPSRVSLNDAAAAASAVRAELAVRHAQLASQP
jgi:hypothetical protein